MYNMNNECSGSLIFILTWEKSIDKYIKNLNIYIINMLRITGSIFMHIPEE